MKFLQIVVFMHFFAFLMIKRGTPLISEVCLVVTRRENSLFNVKFEKISDDNVNLGLEL